MTAQLEVLRSTDDALLIERVFDAPVALVFRLWAEREHMMRWLGPAAFACTHLKMDFRPGGAWRACISSKAQGDLWMGGRYREIEPERRLVYTFTWDNNPGQPGVETLVTVTFAEQDGRTIQRFHQAPFVSRAVRDSHIGGWNESFDKQDAVVERLAGEPKR
jgi:uncharacterized protein YndB with AHSA1/START domain